MDALILSVGTGGGHNAAGYAVKEELLRRGNNVEMMNPYDLKGGKTSKIIDNTYIKLVQIAPKAFGIVYFIGDAYRRLPWRSPVYFANRKTAVTLKEYLESHHFDIIIMPHLFPAEMMTYMECSGWKRPKTLFISTDYTCTPFIEETLLDGYIVPSAELLGEFEGYKIPKGRMYPLGIPSSLAYSQKISKKKAKALLGLDVSKSYILIAGGSMGSGNLIKIARYIFEWQKIRCQNSVPIIICGSNARLKARIEKEFADSCIAVGYTDRMAMYMKASEVFITKPGGLSSTEAASAGIPIVHIMPIPGCESRNMAYFGSHGMSVSAKCSQKSISNALDYLAKSENRDKMVMCQKENLNSKAASDICDLAEKLVVENEKKKELVYARDPKLSGS